MAEGIRLSAAVVFVRNLERSVAFYRELLGLDVADRSPTAALLVAPEGSELVLREFGSNAPHPLGAIGVQYLIWSVASRADLDNLAGILRRNSAYRETRTHDDATAVEGRDPDDVPVILVHAADRGPLPRTLMARIYAW